MDFNTLYQEKFKFEVRNLKYIPASELGLPQQKVPVNRVTFDIENLTAYNYKNIYLQLLLNSGGQIAAINQIPSGILRSGQTISLEVNFFQNLPKIDSVDITPETNIYDDAIFLKF